jgi:hypothetical protein
MADRLVLVTRADLPPGAQAVQAAHAMRAFAAEHPELERSWFERSNTLALLAVAGEAELDGLVTKALDRGLAFSVFREPDLGGQLTAVCFEPTHRSQRLCRSVPLALSR